MGKKILRRRCVWCGGAQGELDEYTLLANALRSAGTKLKTCSTGFFHTRCAIRAITELNWVWIHEGGKQ